MAGYIRQSTFVDGDTITAVFYIHGKPYKFRCRLSAIDTPELRTKNAEEKETELRTELERLRTEKRDLDAKVLNCEGMIMLYHVFIFCRADSL